MKKRLVINRIQNEINFKDKKKNRRKITQREVSWSRVMKHGASLCSFVSFVQLFATSTNTSHDDFRTPHATSSLDISKNGTTNYKTTIERWILKIYKTFER